MSSREKDIFIIKKALGIIIIVSCFLECIIYTSVNSVTLSITTLLSFYLFNCLVFKINIIRECPIAFILFINLFGFMYLPIPITLLDGNPADHDLNNPQTTYILQFLYYCLALFAFRLAYKDKNKYENGLAKSLMSLGFFQCPSYRTIWILGIVGVIPRLVVLSSHGVYAGGLFYSLSYLIFSPVLILLYPLFGGNSCSKQQKIYVLLYIFAISVLHIGTNQRHMVIMPFLILSLGYLLMYFYNDKKKSVLTLKNFTISVSLLLFLSGPVSTLATAMVIVRNMRGDISFVELISETIETSKDKEKIMKYNQLMEHVSESNLSIDWDETYVSNLFLQRFCNYRVVDASIMHAERAGYANPQMQNEFYKRFASSFPGFIPELVFGVEKQGLGSQMDYLYAISRHAPLAIGLRVGGDVGLGLSVFGYLYFLIELIVYYFLFRLLNCLTYRRKDGQTIFSIFILIQIMDIFNLFTVHSGIVRHMSFVIWGWWWNLIVLMIPYKLIQGISYHK